jgi:hypothetical protein
VAINAFRATFHKPSKVAPAKFVMIWVLVYTHRMALSLAQLTSVIERMKKDVSGKLADNIGRIRR